MNNLNYMGLISHNDLDGYGCTVLLKMVSIYHPEIGIDRVRGSEMLYNINCDDRVSSTINLRLNDMYYNGPFPKSSNKILFVTDLKIDKKSIDNVLEGSRSRGASQNFVKVVMIDHHEYSSQYINNPIKMDYLETKVEMGKSGTLLFYEWLVDKGLLPTNNKLIRDFAYYVSMYDTYQWVNGVEPFAETLHIYFTITDNKIFVERMVEILRNTDIPNFKDYILSSQDIMIAVEERRRDIRNTCALKASCAVISQFNEYNIASVACDRYISAIGNYICEHNKDVDFCMMFIVDTMTISLRTVKDDVNLNRICSRLFKGGGHKKAAGARLDRDTFMRLMTEHLLLERRNIN